MGLTVEELSQAIAQNIKENNLNPAEVLRAVKGHFITDIDGELRTLEERKNDLLTLKHRLGQ